MNEELTKAVVSDRVFGLIFTQIIRGNSQVFRQLYDRVFTQVNYPVYAQVENQLKFPVKKQVTDDVWNTVKGSTQ